MDIKEGLDVKREEMEGADEAFKPELEGEIKEEEIKLQEIFKTNKPIEDDKANGSRVPGEERIGEEPIEAEPKQSTSPEEIKAGGILQSKEEVKGFYGDLTRPAEPISIGSRHPISIVKNQIIDIFSTIGFNVSEGPEIEDDWHNFTALNLPEYHPARDMQDTFFIQTNPDVLLRTHTSSVQVRYMENNKPPIRTISPGRVFRNEAVSSRSHCIFHQVEGLYIDKDVSFADLKQTLLYFTKEMFGKSKIRLRPSYFPFTEPSAEVDAYRDWETDRKSTRLNSSHLKLSRMPSSA